MSYIATRAEIDGLFNLCGEVVDIKIFKEKLVLLKQPLFGRRVRVVNWAEDRREPPAPLGQRGACAE